MQRSSEAGTSVYLTDNVLTDTAWEVYEREFDPALVVTTGSNYIIGNGYLGYRGTTAEWTADEYVACMVTDTWDRAADGAMTELCSVPNALLVEPSKDDRRLSLFEGGHHDYERRIDLRTGVFSRRTTWGPVETPSISIHAEKFASYDDVRLAVMRYRVEAHADLRITLRAGVDGRVWSLNGNHFRSSDTFQDDGIVGK